MTKSALSLPKLLRVPEVARILDTSESRIYEMARQDILPVVHLGRQIRIDQETLNKFIRSGGKPLPGGWRKSI